jgi:hypothetical protein
VPGHHLPVGAVAQDDVVGVNDDHDPAAVEFRRMHGDRFIGLFRLSTHSGTSGKSQIRTAPERCPAAITTWPWRSSMTRTWLTAERAS